MRNYAIRLLKAYYSFFIFYFHPQKTFGFIAQPPRTSQYDHFSGQTPSKGEDFLCEKIDPPGFAIPGQPAFFRKRLGLYTTKSVGENITKFAQNGPLTSQIDQWIFDFLILLRWPIGGDPSQNVGQPLGNEEIFRL